MHEEEPESRTVDFDGITGFQWDEGNAWKSYVKHQVSQAEAEEVFFDESRRVATDHSHSQSEPRYHALGETSSGRRLHVAFTLRDNRTKIRVISARDMSPKEQRLYE